MGELTQDTPKCLLDVAGRPFVHYQLRQLFQQGVRRVVMCLGHLGEKVVAALGDPSEFGVDVVYSFDGPELRGTAGEFGVPCLCSGRHFSCCTATHTLNATTQPSNRHSRTRERGGS